MGWIFLQIWVSVVKGKKARVWFFKWHQKQLFKYYYNYYTGSRTKNNLKTTTKICLQCWFKLAISSFQPWLLSPRSLGQKNTPVLWNICLRLQKWRWLPQRLTAALFLDLHMLWILYEEGKKYNWDFILQLQLFPWKNGLWDNILLKLYSMHFLKTRILILPPKSQIGRKSN